MEPLVTYWWCGDRTRRGEPMSPTAPPAGSALTLVVREVQKPARWSASPGTGAHGGGVLRCRRRKAAAFHPAKAH